MRYLKNPANPRILGEDVVDLAITAAGVGAAGITNDKLVAPVIGRFVKFNTSGVEVKLLDAATTAGAGWVNGTLVGFIESRAGTLVQRGGLMLGVAKVISAFIPGFSLSGNIPVPSNFPAIGIGQPAPAPLPAPTNGTTLEASRLGVGSMGL